MNYCLQCMRQVETCGHSGDWENTPEALAAGIILEDRFLLGRVLGRGSFGITYIGYDLQNEQRIAVKEFFPQRYATREDSRYLHVSSLCLDSFNAGLERFFQEGKLLKSLHHRNIVSVVDSFLSGRTGYIVMPYVDGLPLEDYMGEHTGGRIPETVAVQIMEGILHGMEYLHERNLIHRDIKPSNIYLVNGSPKDVVLLDLGSARHAFGEKMNAITALLTPGYAPPEQYALKVNNQGAWTDIYGCGATVYHCLTGKVPPSAQDRVATGNPTLRPSSICSVSPELDSAISSALALEIGQRPQSVRQLRSLLSARQKAPQPVEQAETGFAGFMKGLFGKKRAAFTLRFLTGQYAGNCISVQRDLVFGRDPTKCNVVFDSAQSGKISRVHARLTFDSRKNGYFVEDLGSSYGTYVIRNSRRLKLDASTLYQVHSGDEVLLADISTALFRIEQETQP